MLARRDLPEEYARWNEKHLAPFGRHRGNALTYRLGLDRFTPQGVWFRGPFYWQDNNDTRIFEYPWAYHSIAVLGEKLTIIDAGGGLAGLQFVLAKDGHRVINVDPGMAAEGVGFALDRNHHRKLGAWLRAPVELLEVPLQDTALPDASVDVVLSVSALEHFSPDDIEAFAAEVGRVLKPNGRLIFTADLFLDIAPFEEPTTNNYGRNVDIRAVVDRAGLVLEHGVEDELCGYSRFSPEAVRDQLSGLLVGRRTATLTQLVVAKRPQP